MPVAVVNTLDRALTDPHVLSRNMILDIPGPDDLFVKVAGNPVKMSDNRHEEHSFPPQLGQDTRAVLAERLGLGADEIDRLVEKGVLGVKAG